MTEREQALFDLGKAAFLDSRLDLYGKELAKDDILREIVQNSIERVSDESWEIAGEAFIKGTGTDGEREAFRNGLLAGQLLWDTNFKAPATTAQDGQDAAAGDSRRTKRNGRSAPLRRRKRRITPTRETV